MLTNLLMPTPELPSLSANESPTPPLWRKRANFASIELCVGRKKSGVKLVGGIDHAQAIGADDTDA